MDALDSNVIAPLRPYLLPITRNLPGPVDDFAKDQLGKQCHRKILQQLDLSAANLPCIQLAVSKLLGIGIIAASSIVKVPQIVKLVSSQSAKGLSFSSYALETASFVITLAYNARHGFPFSTYGEMALISVQDVTIAALILLYSGNNAGAAGFIVVLLGVIYALFAPTPLVDIDTLGYLQAGAGILGLASKLPQIWTIYQEGGTGQLSAFAIFNYLAGSISRIFTTLQEVDDKLILYGFIAGGALNAVLAAQMVYYWNSSPAGKTAVKVPARIQDKGASASSTGSQRSSGPSTRRRA